MKTTTVTALRFVVLRHTETEQPHFDLMFETSPGSPLATWRSPAWPIDREVAVTRVVDHRGVYLDYEGPLSWGRGKVSRVAVGECKMHRLTPDRMDVTLVTKDLRTLLFVQIEGDQWRASPSALNH